MSKYLLDSNCFIEPMKRYYDVQIFPTYWQWIKNGVCNPDGKLIVPRVVKDEIIVDPRIKQWVNDNIASHIFDEYKDNTVWPVFRKVQNYVRNCGAYTQASINAWAQNGKADPILIAIARAKNYKVVTFERPSFQFGYNSKGQWVWKHGTLISHEPKIPDIAKAFHVQYLNLFEFQKEVGLRI